MHPDVVGGRGMPWENRALYRVHYLGLYLRWPPLARAGQDNEPDKVQDKDTDIAMAQSPFILDFIRCFVLHAPPAGLRDKVQDKVQDKARDTSIHPNLTHFQSRSHRMHGEKQIDVTAIRC